MNRFRAEVRHQTDPRVNQGLLWVGDKPYPAWLEVVSIEVPLWHQVRRALLHTEGPIALSILWGCATHSDNHDSFDPETFIEEPQRVEVGVLLNGELLGDPLGYQTTDQVLALITEAQS